MSVGGQRCLDHSQILGPLTRRKQEMQHRPIVPQGMTPPRLKVGHVGGNPLDPTGRGPKPSPSLLQGSRSDVEDSNVRMACSY